MRQAYQEPLLERLLQSCLGPLDEATATLLREQLEWVELPGGQTLMAQGEPGDSMYIPVSGRLRAYVRDESGAQSLVREVSRGQVIGEMALFTGEPRSATVVAIRESVLVRLSKAAFDQIIERHPEISAALTRQLIRRLLKEPRRSLIERPVTMALVPVSDTVDAPAFAVRLAAPLARLGRVRVVESRDVDAALAPHGLGLAQESAEVRRRVALLLDEFEAGAEFMLLVADPRPTPWTARCARHADELLLLADAAAEPALHPTECALLDGRRSRAEAAEILVLLHRDQAPPRGTRHWLARRPVADHVHVCLQGDSDFERLARLQSRTAVGLVLGGGGARGFAHLGVLRALAERGVPIDSVGGTSIGSVMAALVASDAPLARIFEVARRAFARNPTGDFNPVPLMSLIRGQRLQRVIGGAMLELLGHEADIEDLRKPCFCVATNYSQAREECLRRGPLKNALLASIAIPGALPPVVRDGDLLCDGGAFNNFPADLMLSQRGIGVVIGVDLGNNRARRIEFDAMPSWWQLALDRLRPEHRRRYPLPALPAYLVNMTTLYSHSRRALARNAVDLYLNPEMGKVGMLEWDRFDEVVAIGFEHAQRALDALDAATRARLVPAAASG